MLPTIFIYLANHQDAVGDVVEWVAAPVSWRKKSNERSHVQLCVCVCVCVCVCLPLLFLGMEVRHER